MSAPNDIFLYAGETNPNDLRLWDPTTVRSGTFPVQYAGLRTWSGSMIELCLVAEVDAPSGMGGVLKVRTAAATRVVYLVETTDPNASGVRLRTTTGIKAIRRKT